MREFTKIDRSFWETDEARDMTPEEKYFWLYLQTNANVNTLGCYAFRMRKAIDETGYNKETIEKLLYRMMGIGRIKLDRKTMELFLLDFPANSWGKKTATLRAMQSDLKEVKSDILKEELHTLLTKFGFFEKDAHTENNEGQAGTMGNKWGEEEEEEKEEEKKKEKKESSASRSFLPPTPKEVLAYCREKRLEYLDPQAFIDFYESKGWLVGKVKMKDWKAAARRWNRGNEKDKQPKADWTMEEQRDVRQSSPENDELKRRLALMEG